MKFVRNVFDWIAVLGVVLLSPALASAAVIVSDAFTGTSGTSRPTSDVTPHITLAGRTPDGANLPTTTYVIQWQNSGFSEGRAQLSDTVGNPVQGVYLGFNYSAFIDITSQNSYVKPTQLTISADLRINNLTAVSSPAQNGIGLGFYPVGGPGNDQLQFQNFTGLTLLRWNDTEDNDIDGRLQLVQNGSATGSPVTVLDGNLDPNAFYDLTYSIDTTTGAITNVSFNGSPVSGLPTSTAFLAAATANAGFYTADIASVGGIGYVDNFSVAAVPEPSSALLIVCGVFGLIRFRQSFQK